MNMKQAVLNSFISGIRKEFLIDFSFPIKLTSTCALCDKKVSSDTAIRAWFEVGGQVRPVYYPTQKHQGKGLSVCHNHTEDEILSFLSEKFQEARTIDKDLKTGDISLTVTNYQKDDRRILERILCVPKEKEALFDYIIASNKRYGEPNIKLKAYREFDFMSAARKYVRSMIEEKMFGKAEAEKTLKNLFEQMQSVFSKNIVPVTFQHYKTKIQEKLTEMMIFRLLLDNEIPSEGYFLKKIFRFIAQSTGEELHKEIVVRKSNELVMREIDEIENNLSVLKKRLMAKMEEKECSRIHV